MRYRRLGGIGALTVVFALVGAVRGVEIETESHLSWWTGVADGSVEGNPVVVERGHSWGVYQTAWSAAEDWSTYELLAWSGQAESGYWGENNVSLRSGPILRGANTDAGTSALVFTAGRTDCYALRGKIGFWCSADSWAGVQLKFVRLADGAGSVLYSYTGHNVNVLDVGEVAALQAIDLRKGERVALVVTCTTGVYGWAKLDDLSVVVGPPHAVPHTVVRTCAAGDPVEALCDTPERDAICLNGVWDRQWIDDKQYDPYSRPDLFETPQSPEPEVITDDQPSVDGEWGTVVLPEHPDAPDHRTKAKFWCRRNVFIPEAWRDRRIELDFTAAGYEIVAYVNGQCIGWHRGDTTAFTFDATEACRFGQDNEILIRVWYHKVHWGEAWHQTLIEAEYGPRTSIWDDLYLRARPVVAVRRVFCQPSFRNKELAVDVTVVSDGGEDAPVTAEAVVLDRGGRVALALGPQTVRPVRGEETVVRLDASWPDPHLWMPEDPYLYVLETRLVRDGQRIDSHRQRFGFVETWIDGADFRVNGKLIHFHQQTTTFYSRDYIKMHRPAVRALLRLYKAFGWNVIRPHDKPSKVFLDVADEEGMFIRAQNGWIHPNNPLTEEFKRNAGRVLREWVQRDRNHPSLIMWSAGNEPVGHWETVVWALEQVKALDPTRPVDFHRSYGNALYGADGTVKPRPEFAIANPHYPIICLPAWSLLTAAEYPAEWARGRPKPLFIGEWGEFGSPGRQSLGPGFTEELAEMTGKLGHGFEMGYRGMNETLEAVIPHWRRMGVSGANDWHGYELMVGYKPPRYGPGDPADLLTVQWDRLDGPGVKFPQVGHQGANFLFADLPAFDLNEHELRYAKLRAPRFAFLPDCSRAQYGGTRFARTVCLVNDTMDDLLMRGEVVLRDGDEVLARAPFRSDVGQGGVVEVPVGFDLPEVDRRRAGRIEIELAGPAHATHALGFDFDIFPARAVAEESKQTVGLYDPVGQTRKALAALGVSVKPVEDPGDLDGVDVLVIGRGSLDERVVEAREAILAFVREGRTVLCLGQEKVLPWLPVGVRIESGLRVPAVWPMAADNPLFADLVAEDLSWWPNDRGDPMRVVGAVASNPYYKPQAGRVRSLLECGERLDRSALLEVREGRGSIRLCQLDLEPVIGICPVADMLLERLVRAPAEAWPTRRVWFVGDDAARGYLDGRLGLEMSDLAEAGEHVWSAEDLVLWMPLSAPEAAISAVADRAVGGGASLLAFSSRAELLPAIADAPEFGDADGWAEHLYVIEADKIIRLALIDREAGLLDGLSNMDLYDTALARYEVRRTNGWTPVAEPGVIAHRRQGESDQLVVTVLRPADGKIVGASKAALHVLLTNLGGVTADRDAELRAGGKFFTVDLRPYCNMAFRDEVDNDGAGGWTDQGRNNDLRVLPLGRQEITGVPFDIIDPATNSGKSCVILGGGNRVKDFPTTVSIDFGHRQASVIYFLHAAAWCGDEVGKYVVHYTKALDQREVIPLIGGQNIGDWWNAVDGTETIVGWRSINELANIGLHVYAWKNPHPDNAIDQIDFVSNADGHSILSLVAITGQE